MTFSLCFWENPIWRKYFDLSIFFEKNEVSKIIFPCCLHFRRESEIVAMHFQLLARLHPRRYFMLANVGSCFWGLPALPRKQNSRILRMPSSWRLHKYGRMLGRVCTRNAQWSVGLRKIIWRWGNFWSWIFAMLDECFCKFLKFYFGNFKFF